jgi:hypothetical protein
MIPAWRIALILAIAFDINKAKASVDGAKMIDN